MRAKLAMKLKALTDLHDALMSHTDNEPYTEYTDKFKGTSEDMNDESSKSASESIFKKLKKMKKS